MLLLLSRAVCCCRRRCFFFCCFSISFFSLPTIHLCVLLKMLIFSLFPSLLLLNVTQCLRRNTTAEQQPFLRLNKLFMLGVLSVHYSDSFEKTIKKDCNEEISLLLSQECGLGLSKNHSRTERSEKKDSTSLAVFISLKTSWFIQHQLLKCSACITFAMCNIWKLILSCSSDSLSMILVVWRSLWAFSAPLESSSRRWWDCEAWKVSDYLLTEVMRFHARFYLLHCWIHSSWKLALKLCLGVGSELKLMLQRFLMYEISDNQWKISKLCYM